MTALPFFIIAAVGSVVLALQIRFLFRLHRRATRTVVPPPKASQQPPREVTREEFREYVNAVRARGWTVFETEEGDGFFAIYGGPKNASPHDARRSV